MLLKATEQCFNTLERAEMLLLLLRRFPETVVQHGVREEKLIVIIQVIGTQFFEILLKCVFLHLNERVSLFFHVQLWLIVQAAVS